MSNNMIFSDIPSTRRVVPVPVGTRPGTAGVDLSDTPYVTITGRGDSTWTEQKAFGVSVTKTGGGVGLPADSATVAVTGTFRFPVTGASATTPNTTLVYITSAGALTLTAGSNKKFGKVDFFLGERSATETAVKIGDLGS